MMAKSENGMMKMILEVGDEFEEVCIGVGKNGDGVFKKNGIVVFAADTTERLSYKLKVLKVCKTYAFAEVI